MIHPNKQSAKRACEEYLEEISRLIDQLEVKYNVSDDIDISEVYASYKDENGETKTYYFY